MTSKAEWSSSWILPSRLSKVIVNLIPRVNFKANHGLSANCVGSNANPTLIGLFEYRLTKWSLDEFGLEARSASSGYSRRVNNID